MNGPILTMAPAAVEAHSPFHRSHSSPDLLSGGLATRAPRELTLAAGDFSLLTQSTSRSSSASSGSYKSSTSQPQEPQSPTTPTHRSLNLKSLPNLPAFDVPSFDLDSDFSKSLRFEPRFEEVRSTAKKAADSSSEAEATTTTVAAAVTVTVKTDKLDKLGKKKPMVERRHSWLPTSRSSSLNLRGLVEDDFRGSATTLKKSKGRDASPSTKVERPKPVESFADFAKRSWKSRSRSPSPSPSSSPSRSGAVVSQEVSQETTTSGSPFKLKAGFGIRKGGSSRALANADNEQQVAPSSSADSVSSASRALNRASVYLGRIKPKPPISFSKSASSLSLASSPSASASNLSLGCSKNDGSLVEPTGGTTASGAVTGGEGSAGLSFSHLSFTPRNSSHTDSSTTSSATGTFSSAENASQSTTDTGVTMPHPTSRDPLWATFRTLDSDFIKFVAKTSTSARMTMVRSTLVPFLRNTAYHPSNNSRDDLSPEDVDRRATILNKWWNGLLELLGGGQSRHGSGQSAVAMMQPTMTTGPGAAGITMQPVAGVDRPTLLEVTTMIMMRPEWRLCTDQFQPLADRCPDERVRPRSWTQSTTGSGDSDKESTESGFLAESAEHNVRTMFQSNLVKQMAIVVEKLSQRHAPLSLVNWCGKACAYAFFFAPGIADVLVRLWALNGDLVGRVAQEFGLSKLNDGKSEDVVALFPHGLGSLGWSSVKYLGSKLRLAAKLPLMTAKILWHGPWVTRWRGGDTDLFFIFCKYYLILAEEFIPPRLPLAMKARAPAFVLVYAQILATLDTTIHRQASIEAALMGPPLTDALHGADATLAPITVPSNLLRGMDENRLIILLKDMLSEHSFISTSIRHTFAQAFSCIMKAATKRTSKYEHGAHFVLCDFLEEALLALDAYQNSVNNSIATSPRPDAGPRRRRVSEESDEADDGFGSPSRPVDYITWPFWLDVGKMILTSNNTMSEIRLLSFIFSLWDPITADPQRKKAVCIDWLLSEDVFEKFFNSWSPMVRAYYARLLCWRVCRDSGSANDLDAQIFTLVSQRLKTVWSHYLWLKQEAHANGRLPPSTAPCHPSPGKKFMIIKTEIPPPQPGLLLGFDTLTSSFPRGSVIQGSLPASTATAPENGTASPSKSEETSATSYKKKWSLLGKVLSFTAAQANVGLNNAALGTGSVSGRRVWDDELEQARRETAANRTSKNSSNMPHTTTGPATPPKHTAQNGNSAPVSSADSVSSTGSSPVYDMAQIVFRFTLASQMPGAHALMLRDRILTRPRLPGPAQSRVGAVTGRGDSPPPITAGLPPDTRRYSGLMHTGLVSEARNARPLEVKKRESTVVAVATEVAGNDKGKRLSVGLIVRAVSEDETASDDDDDEDDDDDDDDRLPIRESTRVSSLPNLEAAAGDLLRFNGHGFQGFSVDFDSPTPVPTSGTNTPRTGAGSAQIQPVKPAGIYLGGMAYVGRSLAEWALVVNECNSFVDRRREEGVLGLRDVEVPTLGVEGMGMRARA